MDRNKYGNKSQYTKQSVLFWTVGILFILSMLSTWLVSNLFAKYVIDDGYSDSARVAKSSTLELWEHEPELKDGIYHLNLSKKVMDKYTYNTVIPGVDIAKDPSITPTISDDGLTYELYIKVIESDYFPSTVTYALTDDWVSVNAAKGIYKYKYVLNTQSNDTVIKILKDDRLYVSEHYYGKDADGKKLEFSLSFEAFMTQVKPQ